MKLIRKHSIPAAIAALAIISAFSVTAPMAMAEEPGQEQIIAMESISAEAQETAAPETVEEAPAVEPEEDRGTPAVAVEAYAAVGVPYEEDKAVVQDAQKIMENEVDKSETTKKYEEITSYLDFTKPIRDEIDEMVDHTDYGEAEKELLKDFTKQGIGGLAGGVLPGIGTVQKAMQAADEFLKAADATTTSSTVYHTVIGVEKTADAVMTTIPGGGLVVTVKEAVKSGIFYAINKIW